MALPYSKNSLKWVFDVPECAISDKYARYIKRCKMIFQAWPDWCAKDDRFKRIYQQAKERKNCHVDHIVPIVHSLVCGLHVPWNLRVLSAKENLKKSNTYWPDCPRYLCPTRNGTKEMFALTPSAHQMRLL